MISPALMRGPGPKPRAGAANTYTEGVGAMKAKAVGDGWCRCGCGRAVEEDGQQQTHRFYASELCAYRGLTKRLGIRTDLLQRKEAEAEVRRAARRLRPKPVPPPRRELTQDELDHLALRYGPLRKVIQRERNGKDREQVVLECRHKKTAKVGRKEERCAKCRER